MNTQKIVRIATFVFFIMMVSGFVAYKSGFFQQDNKMQSVQPTYSSNVLASNTIAVIDTPPGQQATLLDTSDKSFNIMMSSKTMIMIDQSVPYSSAYYASDGKRDSLARLYRALLAEDSIRRSLEQKTPKK